VTAEAELHLLKLFNTFRSLFGCDYRRFADVFLRAYEYDVRGLSGAEQLLVEYLAEMIKAFRALDVDTVGEMNSFVERYRNIYRYVYVVDCLGLPELYAVWCEAGRRGFAVEVKVFVNRDASTKAFKGVFGAGSMADVAKGIDGMVLKRLDKWIHLDEEPKTRDELVSWLVGRMMYAASILLSLAGGNTMILSDHGYDVVRLDSKYAAKHTHIPKTKLALAKLAPALMLKRL